MGERETLALRGEPELLDRLRGAAETEGLTMARMLEFLLDMYDRAAVLGLRPAHPLTHQLSPERKDGTT